MLARIRNEEVVEVLSQVLEDLVRGEFMQLGSRENENERFAHYLKKTFKKTASLIANACKAVRVNCSFVLCLRFHSKHVVDKVSKFTPSLVSFRFLF